MSSRRHRGVVSVGLVGAGAVWESHYRPAVAALSHRLRVAAVYDPVLRKAMRASEDCRAEVASSLSQLMGNPSVQAVLVIEPGWLKLAPAELACQRPLPAFLAGTIGGDLGDWQRIQQLAIERDVVLMTELAHRQMPATNRLKELIATALGPVRRLTVSLGELPDNSASVPSDRHPPSTGHANPPTGAADEPSSSASNPALPAADPWLGEPTVDCLARLIDWCSYVTGRVVTSCEWETPPTSVSGREAQQPVHLPTVTVGLRRPSDASQPIDCSIVLPSLLNGWAGNGGLDVRDQCGAFRAVLECQRGIVELLGPTTISWKLDSPQITADQRASIASAASASLAASTAGDVAGGGHLESLHGERQDAEVLLDQFCRRLLGGLIPIPDVHDVCQSLAWARQLVETHQSLPM
jgi:hypothetical protein